MKSVVLFVILKHQRPSISQHQISILIRITLIIPNIIEGQTVIACGFGHFSILMKWVLDMY